nr:hypothetical protein Iba_chr10dCG4780 [Ipomoea batatas]
MTGLNILGNARSEPVPPKHEAYNFAANDARIRRFCKSPSVSGRGPLKELFFTLKTAKSESKPRPSGSLPVNLFPSSISVWRLINDEISRGMALWKKLELRSTWELNKATNKGINGEVFGQLRRALLTDYMQLSYASFIADNRNRRTHFSIAEIRFVIPAPQGSRGVKKLSNPQKCSNFKGLCLF